MYAMSILEAEYGIGIVQQVRTTLQSNSKIDQAVRRSLIVRCTDTRCRGCAPESGSTSHAPASRPFAQLLHYCFCFGFS
jgi:hypothetical protein